MRLTCLLRHKAPYKAHEVPPQRQTNLTLKNKVTAHSPTKEQNCLYQLNLLISCLNANGYDNTACIQEQNNYNQCEQANLSKLRERNRLQKSKEISHTMDQFTGKQITNLLRKYPTV